MNAFSSDGAQVCAFALIVLSPMAYRERKTAETAIKERLRILVCDAFTAAEMTAN
jgi:hypothetical protein